MECCCGLSLTRRPRDAEREASLGLAFIDGSTLGLRGVFAVAVADRDACGWTVELEEEVDDSRTEGSPSRVGSAVSPDLTLLRVGLCCPVRGVRVLAGASMPEEYEDAELGVGT